MNHFDPRYMQLLVSKLERIIHKKQTIVSVAHELSLSRQTIHKHLLRYRRFGEDGIRQAQTRKRSGPAHNRTSQEVEQSIIQLAQKYSVDGAETLADRVQYEHNITVHPVTIYRILKRNNIRYTTQYLATKKRWKNSYFLTKLQVKNYRWILRIRLATSKTKYSIPLSMMPRDGHLSGAIPRLMQRTPKTS